MKIFRKEVSLNDFIPPIIYRSMRFFGLYKAQSEGHEPYIAPCLHSYAQYHEDLILQSIFNQLKGGFYVDVGANHPSILSNTKKFYDQGWSGINIEPNPLLMASFEKERPRDINLNIGVGSECGEMDFYRMSADTLSTFSKQSALDAKGIYKEEIVDVIRVKVRSLVDIFEKYCSSKIIDFMSVDVEGYDLAVLRSNDWKIFRPKVLVVEINQDEGDIIQFIQSVDYEIAYQNHTNAILIDSAFADILNSHD